MIVIKSGIEPSRHGRHAEVKELTSLFYYKRQSSRAALRSCLETLLVNTPIIKTYTRFLLTWHRAGLPGTELTYPAQSWLTWHRAGLPGTRPAIAVQLVWQLVDSRLSYKCQACLKSGKVTVDCRLWAGIPCRPLV